MESKFSIVITIDGALSPGKIIAELRRQADALDGKHYPAGTTPSVSPAPAATAPVVEAPKAEAAPAPKAAKAKAAKPAAAPAPKVAPVEAPVEAEVDDLELDEDDLELDGTKTLTLEGDVMPAFKAYLGKRKAALGGDVAKAREEISNLMKTKFGVASGRVVDLDEKHYQAALDAIK